MHPVPGCCQHPGCDVRRGHLAIRPGPSSAVCCPQLCDDQQPEALPEAAQLWCRLPWASPVVCEEEVFFFLFFCFLGESLHAHRCQSYQQFERQIKQTTEEFRVHSTSYDKGSCFAMA